MSVIDFDDESMAKKLMLIKKTIQHGEIREMSGICGVHESVISTYLRHAGKIVMSKRKVEKIIFAWRKIEDNKTRNYYD